LKDFNDKGRGKNDQEKDSQSNQGQIMGIYGNVPSQIEADYDEQDNERPEPGSAEVQIKTDEKKHKKQSNMDKYPRQAISREALCAGKWPLEIFTVSL
jgi:hypothetical protein